MIDSAPPDQGASRKRSIPFLDLRAGYMEIQEELDEAVAAVMASGWYLLGQELQSFEAEFAEYVGAHHCVGVANGLDALTLALQAIGVGAGDEVIVPANTYIASWLAVSRVGATPVPVEPDPNTWLIDPALVEAAVTPRTRAIMPVHLFGNPACLDSLYAVAKRFGIYTVEDAAQAHGAVYQGSRIGSRGDVVAWSFYPGKNLGCFGDGGAVTTNTSDIADKVRILRNYGSRVKYHNELKGVNSRLDEIQAAILRVKLRYLERWNARRRIQAERYCAGLSGISGLRLPTVTSGSAPAWHLFVLDLSNRDSVQAALASAGVQTLIHYPIPPHQSQAYANDRDWGSFPIAEHGARSHLSVPIGPHLNEEDQAHVIATLRTIVAKPSA